MAIIDHFLRTLASGVLAIGMLAVAGGPAPAQEPPDPADVDAVFAAWDARDRPGCAVGVMRKGRLVLARGYGVANLDWGVPITPSTVFYAGSVSKQFTAAAVALLHLDGRLSLDDDVRMYLPELPEYDPPVTVRQLVHHTSGVRDIYGLLGLAGLRVADAHTDEEYLDLLARQRELNFAPGTEYLYSNGGYYLLTRIVERVSGTSLAEFSRERIFEPLGMESTHFHDDAGRIVPRRAISYGGNPEAGFRQTYLGNFDKVGAGGLYTTVEDLAKWDRNFRTGEVGGEPFLELMHSRGVLADGDSLSYAMGLVFGEHRGVPTVGHGGSFMGFRADYVRFPGPGLSVAALCNLAGISPGSLTREVAELYLTDHLADAAPDEESAEEEGEPDGEDEAEPEPAAAGSPDDLRPLTAFPGAYRSPELEVTYEVYLEDGVLHLRRPGGPDRELRREEGDRFRAGSWAVEFFGGELGEPEGFRVDIGRVRNQRFDRLP